MKRKICPMLMRGRSKGELAYIKGAVERGDEAAIEELFCLEELCAWWADKECVFISIAKSIYPHSYYHEK